MLKKIKGWFSRQAKDSQSDVPVINNAVAYCTIVLTDEDALIVAADSKDGNDEAMSKLIFLLSSGSLMETMHNLVCQKFEDEPERRDTIIQLAYHLMMQNLNSDDDEDMDEEDDEDPVVDPCNVFKQGKAGVTEDDLD